MTVDQNSDSVNFYEDLTPSALRPPQSRNIDYNSNEGRILTLSTLTNTPMTTALAWALVLLLFPVVLLLWATESRHTRITRWRRSGMTWKAIAARLKCSESTARRWAKKPA